MPRHLRFTPSKEGMGTSNLSGPTLSSAVESVHITVIWQYCWTWSLELGGGAYTPAELSSAHEEAAGQVPRSQLWMLSDFCPESITPTNTSMFQGASCSGHNGRDSRCSPTFTFCFLSPKNHTSLQSVRLKGSSHNLAPQLGFPQIEPPAHLLKMDCNNSLK